MSFHEIFKGSWTSEILIIAFLLFSNDQIHMNHEEQTSQVLIQVQLKHLHFVKPLAKRCVALVGGMCCFVHQLVSAHDWQFIISWTGSPANFNTSWLFLLGSFHPLSIAGFFKYYKYHVVPGYAVFKDCYIEHFAHSNIKVIMTVL